MRLVDIEEKKNKNVDEGIAYARVGGKIVKKFRCKSGPRKGKVVNSASDCNKPINLKRRFSVKKAYASKGKRMVRKRMRTMKKNPLSLRVQRLNRGLR